MHSAGEKSEVVDGSTGLSVQSAARDVDTRKLAARCVHLAR